MSVVVLAIWTSVALLIGQLWAMIAVIASPAERQRCSKLCAAWTLVAVAINVAYVIMRFFA